VHRPRRPDPESWRCYRCEAPFEKLRAAIEHEKACREPFKRRPVKVEIDNATEHLLDVSVVWNPNTETAEVRIKEQKT
jgi:hypothetical protein